MLSNILRLQTSSHFCHRNKIDIKYRVNQVKYCKVPSNLKNRFDVGLLRIICAALSEVTSVFFDLRIFGDFWRSFLPII